MSCRRGFTLAEVAVASVIILVVLSALVLALSAFVRGSRKLELQEGAATLAQVELAGIERAASLPEPGFTARPDSLMGNNYLVETTAVSYDENTIDVTVAVSSGDSLSIEFTRRYYGNDL
ncbi:hypothetical protein CSA37_06305 [Candidatus Fermentibacteria bacterium]|nr:MAG: hypothetical protein CSA37_06305 [Candidatus Fermentibacteria bacterium]